MPLLSPPPSPVSAFVNLGYVPSLKPGTSKAKATTHITFLLPTPHPPTLCTHTQCHSGSVWRVTWAHPEFGQVLATCSFDRTVAIWEEQGESEMWKHLSYHEPFIYFLCALYIVGQRKGTSQGTESHWVSSIILSG